MVRLSCLPKPHYAVHGDSPWKKDVWLIASARRRQGTRPGCAMQSGQPSPIPTSWGVAKATRVPPVAGTFCCSSGTTALRASGRSQDFWSATCASTTTCRYATSGHPAKSRKTASCDISSIRPSIRFGRLPRRSKFAVTQLCGSRFSAIFQAFTWKVKNTEGPITGPYGVGIASAPKRSSDHLRKRPRRNVNGRSRLDLRLDHSHLAVHAPVRRLDRVAPVPRAPAALADRLDPAPVARRDVNPARPNRANQRILPSTERGGLTT